MTMSCALSNLGVAVAGSRLLLVISVAALFGIAAPVGAEQPAPPEEITWQWVSRSPAPSGNGHWGDIQHYQAYRSGLPVEGLWRHEKSVNGRTIRHQTGPSQPSFAASPTRTEESSNLNWQAAEKCLTERVGEAGSWQPAPIEVRRAWVLDASGQYVACGLHTAILNSVSESETSYEERTLAIADDGRIIAERDNVRHATVSGTVVGRIPIGGLPFGSTINFLSVPLPLVSVSPVGASSVLTDEFGDFSYEIPGSSSFVTIPVGGPLFAVFNEAGAEAIFVGILSTGIDHVIEFNDTETEFATAEVSAYAMANKSRQYLQSLIPGFAPTETPLNINVNIDGGCYAFYSPVFQNLNFTRAEAGCPNTAYGSIVIHEYFHHIQNQLPLTSPEYSEAMADVCAAFALGSPVIGPGFYGPGGYLRNIDDDVSLPVLSTDPYELGLPLAGAFWDLRTALMLDMGPIDGAQLAGELWLASHLISSGEIDDQILEDLLWLDDNDGDLGNGSPHSSAIISAFAAHGFTPPLFPVPDFSCTLHENQVQLTWGESPVAYDVIRIFRDDVQIAALTLGELEYWDVFPEPGVHTYASSIAIGPVQSSTTDCTTDVPQYEAFLRGDVDGDGLLQLNDVIQAVVFLFGQEPLVPTCGDALDFDDDGQLLLNDIVLLLEYLFIFGAPPAPPIGAPGFDPTPDGMICQ